MSNNKTYDADIINSFVTEAEKYKAQNKTKLTLDNILLQSKKIALNLIKTGCNASELTKVYKSAGIEVSINKIRNLYFKPKKLRATNHKTSLAPSDKLKPNI